MKPIQPEPTHDSYLAIVGGPALQRLAQSLVAMGRVAGDLGRSGLCDGYVAAATAMATVAADAMAYERAIGSALAPSYMRGADGQLQEALRIMADGARRGVAAARRSDGGALQRSAAEIETANYDVITVAGRLADWQTGAAI